MSAAFILSDNTGSAGFRLVLCAATLGVECAGAAFSSRQKSALLALVRGGDVVCTSARGHGPQPFKAQNLE